MSLKIKYLDKTLPKLIKNKNGDCIDLYTSGDYLFKKGQSILVKLGVAMEIPEGYEAHIYPRSSTFKHHGLLLTNSVGIIDNSYCGDDDEWLALMYATRDGVVKHGTRLVQFRLVENMPSIELEEVEHLGNNSRGGYGTSGL